MFKQLLIGQNRFFKANFYTLLSCGIFYLLTFVVALLSESEGAFEIAIIVYGVGFFIIFSFSFVLSLLSFMVLARTPQFTGKGLKVDFQHHPNWLKTLFYSSIGFAVLNFVVAQLADNALLMIFPILSVFLVTGLIVHYRWADDKGTQKFIIQKFRPYYDFLRVWIDDESYRVPWSKCSYKLINATMNVRADIKISPSGHELYWPQIQAKLSAVAIVSQAKKTKLRSSNSG